MPGLVRMCLDKIGSSSSTVLYILAILSVNLHYIGYIITTLSQFDIDLI